MGRLAPHWRRDRTRQFPCPKRHQPLTPQPHRSKRRALLRPDRRRCRMPNSRCRRSQSCPTWCHDHLTWYAMPTPSPRVIPISSNSCRASVAARRPGTKRTPIASSSHGTPTAASDHGTHTAWHAPCASMSRVTLCRCMRWALRFMTFAPLLLQGTARSIRVKRRHRHRRRHS